MIPAWLKRNKDALSALQSVVAVLAIVGGVIWFLWRGQASERVEISHQLEYRLISDKWIWLQTQINIQNTGERTVRDLYGHVSVRKILPLPKEIKRRIQDWESIILEDYEVVDWPTIGKPKEFEDTFYLLPGERDTLYFDFIVPCKVKTINLYSWLAKDPEASSYWAHSSMHDLSVELSRCEDSGQNVSEPARQ